VHNYGRLALVCIAAALSLTSCRKGGDIPEPGSKGYGDLVSSFYVGLAGLQAGEDVRARQGLTRATEIAPGEPAGWADLGLLELRQQQYDPAYKHVEAARLLAPQNSSIEELLGLIESKRGNVAEAIRHFQSSQALDPTNKMAAYALASESERAGTPQGNAQAREALASILKLQPNNEAALLDAARLAAKSGDGEGILRALGAFGSAAAQWPESAQRQLATIRETSATNPRAAAVQIQFLRNLLIRDVTFRRDLDALRPPAGTLGEPLRNFLRVKTPSSQPAASDIATRFTPATPSSIVTESHAVAWAGVLVADAKATPQPVWSDSANLHIAGTTPLPLPQGTKRLSPHSIAFGDIDGDFKTDILVATNSGLRVYRQQTPSSFRDVTGSLQLGESARNGEFSGIWLFDFDLDGDLDIVLGRASGELIVLRNNGDESWTTVHPFSEGVGGVTEFEAADFDADGTPDVALLDTNGRLHLYRNERLGNFRPQAISQPEPKLASLTAADLDSDGRMDFVAVTVAGQVLRISWSEAAKGVELTPAVKLPSPTTASPLLVADLDNNGSLDLIYGSTVALHDVQGFTPKTAAWDGQCTGFLDGSNTGRIQPLTITSGRTLAVLSNQGAQSYGWQTLRTRAAQTSGDNRINSFGIGGEVEIRSGLLTQKQIIESPVTHFGLGENRGVSSAAPQRLLPFSVCLEWQAHGVCERLRTLVAGARLTRECATSSRNRANRRVVQNPRQRSPAEERHLRLPHYG
jgi:Tfp pilus assembly protein PilF